MRVFFAIWSGQTLSSLGTRITGFALTLWIFEQTGSATPLALMGLSFGVAGIVTNLFAGVIVDRGNRKQLIWLTDTLAGFITLAYLALFVTGRLALGHIYAGTAVRGMLSVIQSLAFGASISLMVPPEQFVRTSSMQTFSRYAGNIVGPGLGALLYATIGLTGVMLVDIATFLIAVTIVILLPISQPEKEVRSALHSPWRHFMHDMIAGFRFIWRQPMVRLLLLVTTFATFFDGFPNALIGPMILARTHNDASMYAAAVMGSGVGGVTMALLVSIWGGPQRRYSLVVLGCIMVAGVAKVGVGLSQTAVGWAIFSGVASATFPLLWGASEAIWLRQTAVAVQGRVFAARTLIQDGAFYLGYGLAPLIADYLVPVDGALKITAKLIPAAPGSHFTTVFTLGVTGMALVGVMGLLFKSWKAFSLRER